MVARLTGKDAVSARQLALETGLRQQTLSRWLQEASSLPIMPAKRPRRDWSIEEKIRVLAAASTLTGGGLADFLQREAVLQADYEQWRVALGEEGRASLATMKRIRTLERELARKEKALAEAAALLVLKKNSKSWRRTRTTTPTRSTSHDSGRPQRRADRRCTTRRRLSSDRPLGADDSALEAPPGGRRPAVWPATSTGQCAQRARGNPGARPADECRVRPSLAQTTGAAAGRRRAVSCLGIDHVSAKTPARIEYAAATVASHGRTRATTVHHAVRANQVWSWDITYLPTVTRGRFLRLYLVMDVWSRRIVGWEVHDDELAERAATLIHRICAESGVDPHGLVLHSDNGKPMRGNTMIATLQWLGIVPSFSRPHVCNDNPYSEALFRTLKHTPAYPRLPFASRDAARQWVTRFVAWYNTEHRHSAIRYVTPDQRHSGDDIAILGCRRRLYERARRRTPGRWSSTIRNWTPVATVILNPEPSAARIDAAS
jgi:transposase InsO family protein